MSQDVPISPPPIEPGRIVVGVDGPESRAALDWAIEEAVRRDAIVEAVMVWHDPYATKNWTAPMTATAEPRSIAATRWSELAGMVDEAGRAHPQVRVEAFLRDGRPVPALRKAAEGADMLVVGGTMQSKVAAAVSRSVTHQLAARPPCPVVIVPTVKDDAVGGSRTAAGQRS